MQITFLGHQGWAFTGREGLVLLDPLVRAMGNGPVRLPVWPPRTLLTERMPPIAGLILSHEHSDHFDLDTLQRLPYRGTVHIPDLASSAMRGALADLGFTVRLMTPLQAFRIGDLAFTPLGMLYNPLERDVHGLLVQGDGGHSFMTTIDGVPHEHLDEWLRRHCPARTLDNYTNNFVEPLPHISNVPGRPELSYGRAVARLVAFAERFSPRRVILSGQGWCFPTERGALNHAFFPVTNEMLADAGRRLLGSIEWWAAAPGEIWDLSEPSLRGVAPYVRPEAPVDRTYRCGAADGPTSPWCGERWLPADALAQVLTFVREEYGPLLEVHATTLQQGLHTLAAAGQTTPEPTIFVRILDGEGFHDLRFNRGTLRFDPTDAPGNPAQRYCAGIEVWASDLHALIAGREEAYLIYESSVRRFCHYPDLLGDPICIEAFAPFAPRFRPAAYLAAYRERLARTGAGVEP